MKNALRKSAFREIGKTKSRFLSIFGIVAIGVGFFSGVKAAAPDMRLTADRYFDRTSLMDFRLVSTYGFDENDIAALEKLDGAEVYPSYFTDVLASSESASPVAARVISLGENSDKVNCLTLTAGRYPENENECLASDSGMKGRLPVGTVVTFTDGNGEKPDDMLSVDTYTIVGTVKTPMYIDKTGYGSTTVGNGSISSVYFVPEKNFCVEYNTEVYLRFPELDGLYTFDDEYDSRIEQLTDVIEKTAEEREDGRYDDIVSEANEKLDDAKKELSDAEKEADDKIADGEKELADAKQQLDDAKKEIEDGERQIADAEREIADGEQQIADGEQQIADAEKELADARREIDKGCADLEEAKKEYAEQIAEAEQKIKDGEAEIDENEQKLKDGETEYEKGLAEYEDGKKQFDEGKEQYNAAYKQFMNSYIALKDGKEQYEAGLAVYNENAAMLDEQKVQLDAAKVQVDQLGQLLGETNPMYIQAKAEYDAGFAAYTQAKAQLDAAKSQLDSTKQQLDAGEQQISAAQEQINDAKAKLDKNEKKLSEAKEQLDSARAELDDGKKQLNEAKEQLADAKRQLEDEKKEAEAKFADAEKELADAEQQYTDGKKELEESKQKLEDAKRELEDAKRELADARQELADGKADYEKGLSDYAEGEKELEDGKAEADEKISDAKRELADAEEKIADLEKPEWYVFTRDDNPGYSEYGENAQRINNIAAVFPVFFILVAALVCLTTMTRMVEEQRVQIGTLKALGYSNGKIIWKYMFYAAAATLTGAVFGVIVGMKLFPFVIITAYGMMYDLPELYLPIDFPTAIISVAVSLFAITATVFSACRSALSEQAAQLMRPKAPKTGKRIFLEKIQFIWKRLNFSNKVTARNLFRYKRKMFMSVVGIAGCTALLLTGFALFDSINDIIRIQYGDLQRYDGIAVYDGKKYPEAEQNLHDILSETGESVKVYQKQMTISADGRKVSAYIAVPSESERFSDFMTLRDRITGEEYVLKDGDIYIDEKSSLLLGGLKIGDMLTISESDTEKYEVTLTAAFENYPGHYVYMTEQTYCGLFGTEPDYNAIYFTHNLGEEGEDGLAEKLLETDGVLAVSFSSAIMGTYQNMLTALNYVIWVIIAAAGALAFIVMYNLTNINITERIREIATLKVLGFFDKEVDAYIFRENILLTLLGTAVGLILGVFLANFVITTAEVDFVMFGRNIYAGSYILAAVLTVGFSVLVTLVMHKRLKNVDMIEALKSVE